MMETADYWLMTLEYAIWNATIASLQFLAEDLNPITLGIAQNVFTLPSSGQPPVTHYANSLNMSYVDVFI